MLVDAERRFAARTAAWIMKAKLPKEEVVVRISMFQQHHIKIIGEEATRIRAERKR